MRLAQHPRSGERLRRILGRVNADVTPTRTTVIVAAVEDVHLRHGDV
jgi:ribosomal protein L12E/L44/L45/RPP1/RPP2